MANNNELYCVFDGVLFKKNTKTRKGWVMVVPNKCRNLILTFFHDNQGQPGFSTLIKMMRNFVSWKGMNRDSKNFVKTCHLCQLCKHKNRTYEGPFYAAEPREKGELIYLDVLGPLIKGKGGYAYILLVLDAFSKHVTLFCLRNAKTSSCLNKILKCYICEEGKPQKIISDHGTQFDNNRWRQALDNVGIEVGYTSIRHPQSNASERYMRVIGDMLRIECFDTTMDVSDT